MVLKSVPSYAIYYARVRDIMHYLLSIPCRYNAFCVMYIVYCIMMFYNVLVALLYCTSNAIILCRMAKNAKVKSNAKANLKSR